MKLRVRPIGRQCATILEIPGMEILYTHGRPVAVRDGDKTYRLMGVSKTKEKTVCDHIRAFVAQSDCAMHVEQRYIDQIIARRIQINDP